MVGKRRGFMTMELVVSCVVLCIFTLSALSLYDRCMQEEIRCSQRLILWHTVASLLEYYEAGGNLCMHDWSPAGYCFSSSLSPHAEQKDVEMLCLSIAGDDGMKYGSFWTCRARR